MSDPQSTNPTDLNPPAPDDAVPTVAPTPEEQAALDALAKHHFTPQGKNEVFDEGKTFADMGLRNSVLKGIEELGFKYPTVTQANFIPPTLLGRDVLGQAKTGSGKTAAFALPLLHMCDRDLPFQAIILAPTRELAIQITEEIDQLGKHTPIRATTLYGGQAVHNQAKKLEKGAQIIVGTPGRVMDMLERGLLHFNNIKHVVLDEVDRMLDIGFREDIKHILSKTPKTKQTVFVSATISPEIERLARSYMTDPEKIVVASGSLTVSLVKQHYLAVQPWDKKRLLAHLLSHEEPDLTIVFCRLKRTVDELAKYLSQKGIEAHAMHGDMPQGKRNTTMKALRGGKLSVLIASDLASRGIDVDDISHVINYDLPDDPEVYVHRIGRTARAGKGGTAWAFVTPLQGELLTKIEILINTEIPRLEYKDFTLGEKPAGYVDPSDRPAGGLVLANGPAGPSAAPEPKVNRLEASSKPILPAAAAIDTSKFPGGIVPTKLPPKLLIKGIKGGRR
jgi:ATP-dependent RNA helicase DeaD